MLFTFTPRFMRVVCNWLLFASLVFLETPVYAGLNDTGITTCSNATQNGLPCPVAGFPRQDAEYGTNKFNFTKLDAAGNALPVTATTWYCVKDNVTGLIWEVKTDDNGLRDKDWTYSWYVNGIGNATYGTCATTGSCDTEKFAVDVNATFLCGRNDWRIPDMQELHSIVDYSIPSPGPTIDASYFPNSLGTNFWTTNQYAGTVYSWFISFRDNQTQANSRFSSYAIRLVRAGTATVNYFGANVDGIGTVTDPNTGLIWAKCSVGQSGNNCETGSAVRLAWGAALTAGKNSTLAGHSDWRVPNVKELQSLVDYTKFNPSINGDYFPNTPPDRFLTASPDASNSSFSSNVSFSHGDVSGGFFSRAGSFNYIRLVRGGQSLLSVTKAGLGFGTVTSEPTGIYCGYDCTKSYNSGTVVRLTAAPGLLKSFGGWSGACSGRSRICSVTMNAAKKVTATFTLATFYFPPTAVTNAPSVITASSARLSGRVTPNGAATTVTFDLVIDAGILTLNYDYGLHLPASPSDIAANAAATSVSANTSGLYCNTHYFYRVKAVNSVGTSYGATKDFTTGACPVTMPDFVITSITLNPSTPVAGGTFGATIIVKNQGTLAANGGFLDVWAVNPAIVPGCGAMGNNWATVGNLAAGASKTIAVLLPAGVAGAKTLLAFVDSWCNTVELNEVNNQLTKAYSVQ